AYHQRTENPLGKTRINKQVLDAFGALRYVGGVLEQAGIAGQQTGYRETKYLPEGEVPGHYREHCAQRLVGYQAACRIGLQDLIRQKARSRFGVVVAEPDALVDFPARLTDQLSHFTSDDGRELLPLLPQCLAQT